MTHSQLLKLNTKSKDAIRKTLVKSGYSIMEQAEPEEQIIFHKENLYGFVKFKSNGVFVEGPFKRGHVK